MIAWICAAVVLVLAIAVVWRLHARGGDWKQRCEDATVALHQVQELMEQQRANAELGRVLADVGGSLISEQDGPVQPPEVLVSALLKYRQRVHEYDSAVQYCLQPVELIPGADEDDLERLMTHVNNARKRLFVARAALVDDDMLQRLPELAGDIRKAGPEDELIAALHSVATAGSKEHAVELGELLSSAVTLTQARFANGPALKAELAEMPVLPPAPWISAGLLRVLRLAMQQVNVDSEATFVAISEQQHVELRFTGDRQPRAEGLLDEDTEASLEDLCRRMDERGVCLTLLQDDPRHCGFVMQIPVADAVGAGV